MRNRYRGKLAGLDILAHIQKLQWNVSVQNLKIHRQPRQNLQCWWALKHLSNIASNRNRSNMICTINSLLLIEEKKIEFINHVCCGNLLPKFSTFDSLSNNFIIIMYNVQWSELDKILQNLFQPPVDHGSTESNNL